MTTPGADFDEYVNGKWKAAVSIPPEKNSYSVSDEIEDELYVTVRKLCRSNKTAIGTLYQSAMISSVQHNNVEYVKKLLRDIDCIHDADDIIKRLVYFMRSGITTMFQAVVFPDAKDTTTYRLYLVNGALPVDNLNFYQQIMSSAMRGYDAYLKKIGKLLDVNGLETIVQYEAAIANAIILDDDKGHPDKKYKRITPVELLENYGNIPWDMLWRSMEIIAPEFVIFPTPHIFKTLNNMFLELTIEQWKIILKSEIIHSLIRYLPPPFDEIHFNFFGRELFGSTRKMPQEKLVINLIHEILPDNLGKRYIEHIGLGRAERIKHDVKHMFELLRKTLHTHIMRNEWMDDATRSTALEKVKTMHAKIAYPGEWDVYTGEPLNKHHFIANYTSVMQNTWNKNVMKIGKHTNNRMWNNGTVEVNAFYYPDENAVVLPIGILQPPFYDVNRSVAWNLGGIGAAIGHEICHGFDNEGKEYDQHGNLAKWWSSRDLAKFLLHAGEMRRALDTVAFTSGKIDGMLTMAEGIADLVGLRIALDALNANKPTVEELREFFESYATSWRKVDRPKFAADILATDEHPPAKIRINLMVAQMDEWYTAFNIGETAAMYVKPTERIEPVI